MSPIRRDRFRSVPEAEGRVLLLIDAFSRSVNGPRTLEGRVKLAKLDFLVRYPKYLRRILEARHVSAKVLHGVVDDEGAIESRMIRYRYGPWDPSYYAVLGSLIGRGLVQPIPIKGGIGYRTTEVGADMAERIREEGAWDAIARRTQVLRTHLDKSGSTLKDLLYEHIPEMSGAPWSTEVPSSDA